MGRGLHLWPRPGCASNGEQQACCCATPNLHTTSFHPERWRIGRSGGLNRRRRKGRIAIAILHDETTFAAAANGSCDCSIVRPRGELFGQSRGVGEDFVTSGRRRRVRGHFVAAWASPNNGAANRSDGRGFAAPGRFVLGVLRLDNIGKDRGHTRSPGDRWPLYIFAAFSASTRGVGTRRPASIWSAQARISARSAFAEASKVRSSWI